MPHLGANIPLADQHLLNFFSNIQAARDNLEQRLNSVAAKQFLVAHYSYSSGIGGAPGFRDRFMLALRDNGERNSAGYPVHLRRIALANGKLDGQLPGNNADGEPGGTILDVNVYTRFLPGLGAAFISFFGFSYKTTSFTTIATRNIRFLPQPNASATIFYGLTHQTSGLNWGIVGAPTKIGAVRVTGGLQGCWDLAPGGLRNTHRQLHDQFEGAGHGEPFKVSVTDVHDNHCFIPTISALGFQYQSLASYQSTSNLPNPFTNLLGRDLVCNGEIPFDAYYGPANTNTFHVMPDNSGLLFLGRELSRTVATPTFAVAPNALCPNSGATTYSVTPECLASRPGLAPPGTGYTWVLGPGLVLVSGQGTASVQVQPVAGFTGTSTVRVVATRTGYAASAPLTLTVHVTRGELELSYYYGARVAGSAKQAAPEELGNKDDADPTTASCPAQLVQLQLASLNAAPPYTVTRTTYRNQQPTGTSSYVLNGNATRFAVSVGRTDFSIEVTGTSLCDGLPVTSNSLGFEAIACGQRLAAYPNPADATLHLVPPGEATPEAAPVAATLYNAQGRAVRRVAAAELDTSTLPGGLYYLVTEQRGRAERQQIRVQH